MALDTFRPDCYFPYRYNVYWDTVQWIGWVSGDGTTTPFAGRDSRLAVAVNSNCILRSAPCLQLRGGEWSEAEQRLLR